MALDRFVYWTKNKAPTSDAIGKVLEDYIGDGGKVHWKAGRWFVDLPGTCSAALRRVADVVPMFAADGERWFEVWPDPSGECVDVMTRMHDEYTNALAKGFVDVIKRFWNGKDEPEGHTT